MLSVATGVSFLAVSVLAVSFAGVAVLVVSFTGVSFLAVAVLAVSFTGVSFLAVAVLAVSCLSKFNSSIFLNSIFKLFYLKKIFESEYLIYYLTFIFI